jgi:hypothetical protein
VVQQVRGQDDMTGLKYFDFIFYFTQGAVILSVFFRGSENKNFLVRKEFL